MTRLLLALACLARVASASDTLWVAIMPGGASTTVSATANQMWCGTVVTPFGLAAGIHNVYGASAVVCSSGVYGWAVYPDSDTAAPLVSFTASCTTAGIKSGSASGRLQDNTPYRMCFCSSIAASGSVIVSNGVIANLLNAFAVRVGDATNPCVAGVPPSSTGALIADVAAEVPFLKLE